MRKKGQKKELKDDKIREKEIEKKGGRRGSIEGRRQIGQMKKGRDKEGVQSEKRTKKEGEDGNGKGKEKGEEEEGSR